MLLRMDIVQNVSIAIILQRKFITTLKGVFIFTSKVTIGKLARRYLYHFKKI